MARMVYRDATGPQEVPPQEKSVYVCMCGLSQKQPFCDGSHKKTRDEQPGKCCLYDKTGQNVTEIRDDT